MSAFTTVMFVMQACYGTPQQFDDPNPNEDEKSSMVTDAEQVDQEALVEAGAE